MGEVDWTGEAVVIAMKIVNGRSYTLPEVKRLAKEFIVQTMSGDLTPDIIDAVAALQRQHKGSISAFNSHDRAKLLAFFRARGFDVD